MYSPRLVRLDAQSACAIPSAPASLRFRATNVRAPSPDDSPESLPRSCLSSRAISPGCGVNTTVRPAFATSVIFSIRNGFAARVFSPSASITSGSFVSDNTASSRISVPGPSPNPGPTAITVLPLNQFLKLLRGHTFARQSHPSDSPPSATSSVPAQSSRPATQSSSALPPSPAPRPLAVQPSTSLPARPTSLPIRQSPSTCPYLPLFESVARGCSTRRVNSLPRSAAALKQSPHPVNQSAPRQSADPIAASSRQKHVPPWEP